MAFVNRYQGVSAISLTRITGVVLFKGSEKGVTRVSTILALFVALPGIAVWKLSSSAL